MKKRTRKGAAEYLVHWVGFDDEAEYTWEPASGLPAALVAAFGAKPAAKRGAAARNKPAAEADPLLADVETIPADGAGKARKPRTTKAAAAAAAKAVDPLLDGVAARHDAVAAEPTTRPARKPRAAPAAAGKTTAAAAAKGKRGAKGGPGADAAEEDKDPLCED